MPTRTPQRASDDAYRAEGGPLEENVGYLVSAVRHRLMSALDAEMAAYDITSAQWTMLVRIANGMGHTAADLCRCSGYDTGSMTRMLARLEEKGLIRRERSADDRRVVLLELTRAGRALYPKLRAVAQRVLDRRLEGFSAADVATLKRLLRRML